MRNVSIEAAQAFVTATPNNGNFKEGNTTVSSANNSVYLYLHGNIIAIKSFNTGITFITNAGWKTAVTKERLNALPGVEIKQKAGKWFLNNKEWDGSLTEIK